MGRIAKQKRLMMEQANKRILGESYEGGIIQQDDVPCDIWCKEKLAKYGSNGFTVQLIQNLLAYNGFNNEYLGGGMTDGCGKYYERCDGKFRKHTKDAVLEFQRKFGIIPVDGVVGYDTLSKMCEVLKGSRVDNGFDLLCNNDCNCQDDNQKDNIDNHKDDFKQINGDIDCEDLRYCVDKYIFGGTVPDMSGFISCYHKKDKTKGDMDEEDWRNIEMDGFVEGCAWYIKSNALSSGRKYISDCPSQLDCMPGPGRDMRYCNSKKIQACKSQGCTKITY